MLLSEQITLMSDQNHCCLDNVSWHILLLISSTDVTCASGYFV